MLFCCVLEKCYSSDTAAQSAVACSGSRSPSEKAQKKRKISLSRCIDNLSTIGMTNTEGNNDKYIDFFGFVRVNLDNISQKHV